MSRRLPAVLLLVSAAAGCGITPTEPFLYGLPPANRVSGVQMYFRLDGEMFEVLRSGPLSLGVPERIDLLLAGPTDDERAAGIETSVPDGYRRVAPPVQRANGDLVVVVDREGGVDLARFDQPAGAQIACTVSRSGAMVKWVVVSDPAGRERGPFTCE